MRAPKRMSARASRRRSASEKNKAVNLLIRVLLVATNFAP